MSTPIIEDESDVSTLASSPCIRQQQRPGRFSSGRLPRPMTSDSSTVLEPNTPIFNDNESFDIINDSISSATSASEDRKRLIASIARLRETLASSTAILNNLRIRNQVTEIEFAATEKKLKEAERARDETKTEAERIVERGRCASCVLLVVLVLAVVTLVAYGVVSWCNGPEMAYIRMRRREVLGL